MNYTEAIMTIVRYGKEFQAIEELFGFVKRKNEKTISRIRFGRNDNVRRILVYST